MPNYDMLDVSVDGREDDVFRIALDNPEKMNVVNELMHEELTYAFREAYDSDTRVVVLTGTGDSFSAGGDIGWMQGWIEEPERFRKVIRDGEEVIESFLNLEKPVIARINGDAVGLGATLALFADITIASDQARIGDPHVKVGLVAGDGSAAVWPLLVSLSKAKEYLLTGKLMTAEEAVEYGLINQSVPPDELDQAVDEMVDTLASLPQPAVRYTKQALNTWLQLGVDTTLRQSLALEGLSAATPDHEEAVTAFLEDRAPDLPSARSPSE